MDEYYSAAEEKQFQIRQTLLNIIHSRFDELAHEDLFIQAGHNKGLTTLWLVCMGDPILFLKVWERFSQYVSLATLLQTVKYYDTEVSMLWLICQGVFEGETELFLKVCKHFDGLIPLEAFLQAPQEGDNEGISALSNICCSTNHIEIEQWLQNLLEQTPGIIDESQHNIDRADEYSLNFKFKKFIIARNHFFRLLKTNNSLTPANIAYLFKEAEDVTNAGYINGFYDLGEFFKNHDMQVNRIESIKRVPKSSCYFSQVQLELSEYFFAQAILHFDDEAKKWTFLNDSLNYALQTDDNNRALLIQRIASIYIEGKKRVGDNNLVPHELLAAMNSDTPLEWCINRFIEIKYRNQLVTELAKTSAELTTKSEELNLSKIAMKHLLTRMEELENENKELKKPKISTQKQYDSETDNEPTTLMFSTSPIKGDQQGKNMLNPTKKI
jgi:hypothetical protein